MSRAAEDEPLRPLSYRLALAGLMIVPVALALLCVAAVHPAVGRFRTIPSQQTTRLRLTAGDRFTLYGDNWAGDVCSIAPRSGAVLRRAGFVHLIGHGGATARYDLFVRRTGTYRLSCNLQSFGDSPDDLYLGPYSSTVTLILIPFFPGIPLAALVAWRMVRARRRRAELGPGRPADPP